MKQYVSGVACKYTLPRGAERWRLSFSDLAQAKGRNIKEAAQASEAHWVHFNKAARAHSQSSFD